MYKIFKDNTIVSEQEVRKKYPNSMYILKNVEDVNNVRGILIAVSTSRDSYRDICILRKELADSKIDCTLLGSYNGGRIGVLNENRG